MDSRPPTFPVRAPFHLYLVGLVSLFWNSWGATIAIRAQTGRLPNLTDEQQQFFAAQPTWFVIIADLGLFAGIAGALALLVQHRSAPALYATMFGIILVANIYDLASGSSPMLAGTGAVIGTLVLFGIMAAEFAYASRMRRRRILS